MKGDSSGQRYARNSLDVSNLSNPTIDGPFMLARESETMRRLTTIYDAHVYYNPGAPLVTLAAYAFVTTEAPQGQRGPCVERSERKGQREPWEEFRLSGGHPRLLHDKTHFVGHKDIHPGSIVLFDDGRALLTDFGIAHRRPRIGTRWHVY